MQKRFINRVDAGRQLAYALENFAGENTVVYAIPRGGIVLGYEVAKVLDAPLDIVITRKIGHPFYPEYAVCSVGEGGEIICNEEEKAELDPGWFETALTKEKAESDPN